ncbi:MAG TPA: hypothetical protein ENI76_10090, partial [Ignavibacteria bacterium]|nr:hypothetical protein [Ignavibacteria bacterium]
MPNAKDINIEEIPPLRVWVCGDSGTGKSVFASTFPTPGLVLDFDDGILSYRGKDFDYVQFPKGMGGWEKLQAFLMEMRKETKNEKGEKSRAWDRYKTIILDSTTSFTDLAMTHALAIGGAKIGPGGSPLWNVHYAIVKSLIEGNIRRILDFKGNVVVIGHLSPPEKDDITGEIHIRP